MPSPRRQARAARAVRERGEDGRAQGEDRGVDHDGEPRLREHGEGDHASKERHGEPAVLAPGAAHGAHSQHHGAAHHEQPGGPAHEALRRERVEDLVVRLGGRRVVLLRPVERRAVALEGQGERVEPAPEHRGIEKGFPGRPPDLQTGTDDDDGLDPLRERTGERLSARSGACDQPADDQGEDEPRPHRGQPTAGEGQEEQDERAHHGRAPGRPGQRGHDHGRGQCRCRPENAAGNAPLPCEGRLGEPDLHREHEREEPTQMVRMSHRPERSGPVAERRSVRPRDGVGSRDLQRGVGGGRPCPHRDRRHESSVMTRFEAEAPGNDEERHRRGHPDQPRVALIGPRERRQGARRERCGQHGRAPVEERDESRSARASAIR